MSGEIRKPWIVIHVENKKTCHLLGDARNELDAMNIMRSFIESHNSFDGYLVYARIQIKYQPERKNKC